MAKKLLPKFSTLGEHLEHTKELSSIFSQLNELDRISELIYTNFPHLRKLCHCGAIDYPNDMLVLYTSHNGAFHQINNLVPLIQTHLESNGIYFHRLLVKSNPRRVAGKLKVKKSVLDEEKHAMLEKFAQAINRPDLLRPLFSDSEKEDANEWDVEL